MNGLNILIIDDSEQDVFLIGEVLEQSGVVKSLHSVSNGELALQYLMHHPPYQDSLLPDLILLDINMPVMDGHETLEHIKTDKNLKHIPVIMLTTSSASSDIKRSYQHHTNSYIIKPYDIADLTNLADMIRDYWLNTVKLSR